MFNIILIILLRIIMDPYLILGLDPTYNIADAIDSYNTLIIYYKNLNIIDDERITAINQLDTAINIIKGNSNVVNFIEVFNGEFEKRTKEDLIPSFGYIEKINY
jgi:hypothetical protein